jgi:hypothetical protein
MNKYQLSEGLNYKDMVGILKPTVHIDEFVSKMGEDADIAVVSFYVRDKAAAKDLVNWLEIGYSFILDADTSPGELSPNRYLVYAEIKRRTALPKQLEELLTDLITLTEHKISDWMVSYMANDFAFDVEHLKSTLILSPHEYREWHEHDLNEMRQAAGIKTVPIYRKDEDILNIQRQARII